MSPENKFVFGQISPEEIAENKPRTISPTQLIEFMACPACWDAHRNRGQKPPTTTEQKIGSLIHDFSPRVHRRNQQVGLHFRSPASMISYFQYYYPEDLKQEGYDHWMVARKKREVREFIELDSEFLSNQDTVRAGMVVYYLRNGGTKLETSEKWFETTIEGERKIPLLAIIDQVRLKEISRGSKLPTYRRQIVEIKKQVSQGALPDFAIQTGFQRLVYQRVYPKRAIRPEIVVYDFATGDFYYRSGGDESLLTEGIVLAVKAMDRGYNEINFRHHHYPGLSKLPERYMDYLEGFGVVDEKAAQIVEAREDYQKAQAIFREYTQGCSWEKQPSSLKIEISEVGQVMIVGNVYCGDCSQVIYWDTQGHRHCLGCGPVDR